MSIAIDAPQRASTVYAMSEAAHLELVQVRNQLQLMAQLTTAVAFDSAHNARLRPDALARFLSRLQQDIDAIIAASSVRSERKKIPRAHA